MLQVEIFFSVYRGFPTAPQYFETFEKLAVCHCEETEGNLSLRAKRSNPINCIDEIAAALCASQ